jgi:hypothetical protein
MTMAITEIENQVRAYNQQRKLIDAQVLAGTMEAPACFTCKKPSTHVTNGITPAGYRAYQCTAHVPENRRPLWGSDPGWRNDYVRLPQERGER